MTDRKQYVDGLRQLADLLEKHDDLPVPTHGDVDWLIFHGNKEGNLPPQERLDEQKATAAVIARRVGAIDKDRHPSWLFNFTATLGGPNGLKLTVVVNREAVCERVVTGTEEVTKRVPDPAAMAQVPEVEVTETVETVEWRCLPLLADREAVSA